MMPDNATLVVVIGSAVINAFNPATIGVLVTLLTVVLGEGRGKSRMALLGGAYIVAVLALNAVIGLGLLAIFSGVTPMDAQYIAFAVSLIVIISGLLHIKTYFWYDRGPTLRLPHLLDQRVRLLTKRKVSLPEALLLGVLTVAVELFWTGAPYLAIIALLATNLSSQPLQLMAAYNIIFVLPLLWIVLVTAGGGRISNSLRWKEDRKSLMRMAHGLLLIALGWALLLTTNGALRFG